MSLHVVAVARAADEDVGRAVADVGAAAALRALVLAGGAGQALALRRRALAAVRQLEAFRAPSLNGGTRTCAERRPWLASGCSQESS